jgi:hypothetical protein
MVHDLKKRGRKSNTSARSVVENLTPGSVWVIGFLSRSDLFHKTCSKIGKRQIAPTFNGWGLLCMLRCYRVVLQVSGNDVEYGSKFSIAAGSSISMFGIFSNT